MVKKKKRESRRNTYVTPEDKEVCGTLEYAGGRQRKHRHEKQEQALRKTLSALTSWYSARGMQQNEMCGHFVSQTYSPCDRVLYMEGSLRSP